MMEFLLPMLAVQGEPFDSPEYLFEVKWNGIRALTASEHGQWRIWGRDRADYGLRYPELEFLGRLPSGTVLDGELILLSGGLPDFEALLARHQRVNVRTIQHLGQRQPVTYVVFDVLAVRGRSLLGQPLQARRQILQELVQTLQEPRLVFSQGVVGSGRVFFEQVVRQGQEGVMAKHLASQYVPGRRTSAWRKIKPSCSLPGVIVGFVPGRGGFRSLLVAALEDGQLRYVANVCSGFTAQSRTQLNALLAERIRRHPVVTCPCRGTWVTPDLYCQVRFLEWTRSGRLRGASFRGLLLPGTPAENRSRLPRHLLQRSR